MATSWPRVCNVVMCSAVTCACVAALALMRAAVQSAQAVPAVALCTSWAQLLRTRVYGDQKHALLLTRAFIHTTQLRSDSAISLLSALRNSGVACLQTQPLLAAVCS